MRKKTIHPMLPEQRSAAEKQTVPDDIQENCKGQCGYTPWCRDCMMQKQKILEERLNREGRSDDNKE
jgi:hypothetical protein